MQWEFDMDKEEVDKQVFTRLYKRANIWVNTVKLKELQKSSKNINAYAINLMWELLIPVAERHRLLDVKVDKAGFVKLFGSDRIDAVYSKFWLLITVQKREFFLCCWLNCSRRANQSCFLLSLDHLLEFHASKKKQKNVIGVDYSPHWEIPLLPKKILTRNWGKQFNQRIATAIKSLRESNWF